MTNTIARFGFEIHGGSASTTSVAVTLTVVRNTADGSLSPHLMTESEVDQHIAALKDDLDDVGSRAKAALRQAMK